jgi:hypothetical protein
MLQRGSLEIALKFVAYCPFRWNMREKLAHRVKFNQRPNWTLRIFRWRGGLFF